MASSSVRDNSQKRKKGNSEEETLEDLVEQMQAFLDEKPRKRKKEVEFEFHRDPSTGLRKYHHKYRPRSKSTNTNVTNQDQSTASSFEAPSDDVYNEDDALDEHEDHEQDQSLEALIEKCQGLLNSMQSVNVKWEKRMTNLNENWEAARPLIFKTILILEGSDSVSPLCGLCHQKPWLIRCVECGGKTVCPECDAVVHDKLLFHDREAFLDGAFRHIPPTLRFNEDGHMEITSKYFLSNFVPQSCPDCQEEGSALTLCPLSGSVIVVTQKGRFDFSNYIAVCHSCSLVINPMSLENVLSAGYWPGSPKDCTYFFEQNLFRQWDFLQKRLPGTSEVSFLKSLGDFSQSHGRASTITAPTFSRSFKEWKFCMHELQVAQGFSWMECPACSLDQHSCHVDGNMKLYRYKSSGKQKRPCYYDSLFIACKNDVDKHIKDVYAKSARSKNVTDSMCGESRWKAAENTARHKKNLDETGLEIAGCRHGLAQWAVNMFQGEIYGYANYIQAKKMLPAGVRFFWEDIVCRYWKWASKIGREETKTMRPALSVMHAKAHKWSCQILWGGRWQEGSACSTGEEVEQINAHMSRCGNTTKYMLPEGRDEIITEHAISWNKRKICSMVPSIVKRFSRALKMCISSYDDCDAVLEEYGLDRKQLNIRVWKEEIIEHAKEEDVASTVRENVGHNDNIKQQMELLVFSIMRTTSAINKEADTSKQRTRLRKKLTLEKSKLQSLLEKYNSQRLTNGDDPLMFEDVIAGNFLDDVSESEAIPIRAKSKVVDAFEIHARWKEEVELLKVEMANFLKFYSDVRIPAIQKSIASLQEKIDNRERLQTEEIPASLDDDGHQALTAVQTIKYACSVTDHPLVLGGKIALLKKGLFFCHGQVKKAILSFQKVLRQNADDDGDEVDNGEDSDSESVIDDAENDTESIVDVGVEDIDSTVDGSEVEEDEDNDGSASLNNEIVAPMRSNNRHTVFIWEFPHSVSQSTYRGRNGSNACSIIALMTAQEIHRKQCDLAPSPFLPSDWVALLCRCIESGNKIYDLSRASLPQRYLSAAEAAMVAGNHVDVIIGQPLPVRVRDPHPPSTLSYHLLKLCNDRSISLALLTANEKTVLFSGIRDEKLVLVDSHQHGQTGALVILGHPPNIPDFVQVVKEALDLDESTFGNMVFITF